MAIWYRIPSQDRIIDIQDYDNIVIKKPNEHARWEFEKTMYGVLFCKRGVRLNDVYFATEKEAQVVFDRIVRLLDVNT